MNFITSATLGAVLTLGAISAAVAQEAEVLPITLSSVTIERYAELIEEGEAGGVACCAPLVLSQPGHHFVYVRAIFDVAWSDEVDRISVSYTDIGLQLPGDAEPRRMVGRMTRLGEFQLSGTSLNARRPRDWPAETEQGFLNAVFLVPDSISTGTLVFNETTFAQEISLAAEVTELVDPASLISVNLIGLTEVDEVLTEEQSGRQDITGRLAPSLGAMMQLDLSVQPLQPNGLDGDTDFFYTIDAFTLVGPDNAPLHRIGIIPNGGFAENYSFSSQWRDGSLPNARTLRLYFAGNAAPGVYKVFYHGTPVADITME